MIEALVNGTQTIQLVVDKKNPKNGLINNESYQLDVSKTDAHSMHVIKNHKTYSVEIQEIIADEKKVVLLINGTSYQVEIKDELDQLLLSMGIGGANTKQTKEVKAPMPGLVIDILVKEGDTVNKGDALLILEAMKMENVLKSATDGVVKSVNVTKGIAVEKNQVLLNFV